MDCRRDGPVLDTCDHVACRIAGFAIRHHGRGVEGRHSAAPNPARRCSRRRAIADCCGSYRGADRGPAREAAPSRGMSRRSYGRPWPVVEIDSICCSGGAKYIGAGSFQRDSITEQRQTEEARRGSEERFRQFAGASSDVLWIRDAETLRLASVGSALERIDGLPSGYRLHQTATRSEAGSGWSCRRSVAPRRSPAFCGIDRDRYD